MVQKTEPFLETKWGWDLGKDNWNSGMDENLKKFSFLLNSNIDSIVDTLPSPVDGESYYLTTDGRVYFAVGSAFTSTPIPLGFKLRQKSTGTLWEKSPSGLVEVVNPAGLEDRIVAVEGDISSLGSAAFSNVSDFVTPDDLSISEASTASYIDENSLNTNATFSNFTLVKNNNNYPKFIQGLTSVGDGGYNLFVKDLSDSTSLVDNTRATSANTGVWKSVFYQEGVQVPLPTTFNFTPQVEVIKTTKGFSVAADVRGLMPTLVGTDYYVDTITGNNANSGTKEAPLKSISTALNKSDVARVFVAPGFYHRLEGWGSNFPTNRDFTVERWEGVRAGPVIVSTAEGGISWTVNSTYSSVYQVALSLVNQVRDYSRTSSDGTPFSYQNVQSLLAVSTTPGSWYTDGTTLYIQTLEGGKPHLMVKVFRSVSNAFFNTARSVMVDGIEFHGGREAFYPNNTGASTGLLIARNCKFMYAADATYGNGVRLEGVVESYFYNCEASHNRRDGFNYHISGTNIPKVVEINCTASYNGQGGSEGINNASTMHDAGSILRIGGVYSCSEGPNIADVGDSHSCNIGVSARNSRLGLSSIANADFYTSGGPMWLYSCDSEGSLYSVVATGTGTISACRTPIRVSSGTVNYYQQLTGPVLV
jgi:hypothetical protein